MNGPYFAAQLQVAAETGTITVIATDRDNVQHQASASVMVNMLPDSVQLTASPGTGIMTVKQQTGRTTLDVLLAATASISNTVTSYAWDFSGSGSNNLTCYSHSNVTASYQEIGLYLAQVTIRDSSGNEYRDNVIVNVVDSNEIDNICTAIWNNMKTALLAENIEGALGYFVEVSRDKYGQIFTELGSANINSIFTNITELRLSSRYGKVAQYWALRVQPEGTFAYPVTFVQDENGLWKLMGF